MIVHTEYAQGSVEWMIARSGIPTASEFDQIVTADGELRKGEMPRSYLAKKLAEWWQGGPLLGFNVFDADQGRILEEEAKPWYTLETGQEITNVGFITTDDGRIGSSPDGLLGQNCGIEFKCPRPETHVKYLLDGSLPRDYSPQVYGSLYVTGFESWKFVAYRRHFPPLIIRVERDPKIIESISESLAIWLAKFDSAKQRLIEINGGPPLRATPHVDTIEPVIAAPDTDDVIP